MHAHVAKTLSAEQIGLYERIQRVIYPYVVGSQGNREVSTLSADLDELITSLVESQPEAIPDGYELKWTVSEDITALPVPELVKAEIATKSMQDRLPLEVFGESNAA